MTLQEIFDAANKAYTERVEAERKEVQAVFDAINAKNKTCCMCGRAITEHTPLGWAEQDLCSGGCWAELHGEP